MMIQNRRVIARTTGSVVGLPIGFLGDQSIRLAGYLRHRQHLHRVDTDSYRVLFLSQTYSNRASTQHDALTGSRPQAPSSTKRKSCRTPKCAMALHQPIQLVAMRRSGYDLPTETWLSIVRYPRNSLMPCRERRANFERCGTRP